MAGNSPEYEAFAAKFQARHTSDDTFTPGNVYDCVRAWAVRRYRLEGRRVLRPFWPGADFTKADYPEGAVVVDNPPFSILARIVRWYNDRAIPYFLFCNGLTAFWLVRDGRAGVVCAAANITYDNGAGIMTNFVTNLSGDVLLETACDLHDALARIDRENLRTRRRTVRRLRFPPAALTGGGLNYLAVHHVPFTVRKRDALFVRRLDCGVEAFGGGFLLSGRAEVEHAAARRAAEANAAAEVLALSDRERELQGGIG